VKASPEDQALLLDVQRLDTRLAQLDHRARRLPQMARLAELGAQEDALAARLAERTGVVEDSSAELARVESDVALVEARTARDRQRLQSSSSSKEAQGLESELASLARRQSDLEDIQLSVMETLEQAQAALDETRGELAELREQSVALRAERDTELAAVEGDRVAARTDRDVIAGKVPADLLALYEKQRARYGTGASLLRGGVTSASGVALNGSDLSAIRAAASDDVILCPDSNAILVRTGESGL